MASSSVGDVGKPQSSNAVEGKTLAEWSDWGVHQVTGAAKDAALLFGFTKFAISMKVKEKTNWTVADGLESAAAKCASMLAPNCSARDARKN